MSTDALTQLLQRAEAVLARFEATLPPPLPKIDWQATAFRCRKLAGGRCYLEAVPQPHSVPLTDLTHIDRQKERLLRNTAAFVAGRPANNVLLTGARGTGKSSLVKALLPQFAAEGLRLVEVDKTQLVDLPDIVQLIADRPERFILYCDDLSFEEGDDAYKALKTALDGGIARRCNNALVYATSNRRHLMPERMRDNLEHQLDEEGEIRPGETTEEKVSLSERFGLWLSFYPFSQEDYLAAVAVWLNHFKLKMNAETEKAALRWALMRGARSGRVAWQFACDWAGRKPKERKVDLL